MYFWCGVKVRELKLRRNMLSAKQACTRSHGGCSVPQPARARMGSMEDEFRRLGYARTSRRCTSSRICLADSSRHPMRNSPRAAGSTRDPTHPSLAAPGWRQQVVGETLPSKSASGFTMVPTGPHLPWWHPTRLFAAYHHMASSILVESRDLGRPWSMREGRWSLTSA